MNFILKIVNRTTSGPYWVMYDNECGLCYRITAFFKFFDVFNKIQWVDKKWDGDFPIEGKNEIHKTVVVYNPSINKLYFRSQAVSKIIGCIPLGFLFSWVFRIPGLSVLFDKIYDKVSENRMRICQNKD